MAVKYFGPVTANIDKNNHQATLTWGKRKHQPLEDRTRQACVSWAIEWLKDRNYQVDTSGVEQ